MRKGPSEEQQQSARRTFPELTDAELRRVTGGQEMDHGGRIRW